MVKCYTLCLSFALLWLPPFWPIGPNPAPDAPFIIINKADNELTLVDDNRIKMQVPVATGHSEDVTPEGLFTVTVKAENPYYRKKDIPGGSPENPLGSRWIGLDAEGTDGRIYGIHGNNNPDSIGGYVTSGCVRMYENDVQRLFNQVPIGTKVLITDSEKSALELARKYGAME